ncbi:hypothetical protein A343_2118 [Porphyromonas gingivalis JCVI SC001]|nr:hypothetical protein A343_2118 [Porphyromonas gingivalis JCVI SC001]
MTHKTSPKRLYFNYFKDKFVLFDGTGMKANHLSLCAN